MEEKKPVRQPTDEEVRQYLLGHLPEEQKEAFEAYIFSEGRNADYIDYLQAMERELVEDYLFNHLDPGEKSRFETHFLGSPSHRELLEDIRAMIQFAQKGKKKEK